MPAAEHKRAVIFDTDIGIDDAMALLFLHYAPTIEIVGITTRFGNASVENTTNNALAVAEKFSISAAVYKGAAGPLGNRLGEGFPTHVHGENGMGNIELGKPSLQAESIDAAHAIVNLCKQHESLSIVAVGGLTNIAAALALDASIAQQLDDVVIMGGAFGYSGHRGNVSPVAEANIASDPLAADIVFSSEIQTSVVGLDVTHEVVFGKDFIQELAARAGEAGRFIREATDYYLNFYHSLSGEYQCPLHDSCAVAFLLRPDLFTTVQQPVRVVSEGIAIGQTIHSNDIRRYVSEEWDGIPKSNVCTAVDAAGVLDLYQSTLALAGE
ncbi:MAG: nucleoside hydrolase [Pseudomonadales bacterium]|nr:nucleoside hydrolase [Pseudomonadales bacterium]